jgi:hypothetical protein
MRPTQNEEVVYQAVVDEELRIDGQGRIWRVSARRGNRWANTTSLIRCHPRRAEVKVTNGYLQVRVMWNNKRVAALAHRLVWLHFYGPIPPDLTVNHRNGKTNDNDPGNLELATYSYQVIHSWRVLKRRWQSGETNHRATLTESAVLEIRRRRLAGEKLKSIATTFAVSDREISKVARRDRWAFLG